MFRISTRWFLKIAGHGLVMSLIAFAFSFSVQSPTTADKDIMYPIADKAIMHPIADKGIVHPIYVSVTEINHNSQDKNLEIACKIFTDDLETVLAEATGQKIDLFNPKDTALTGRQIAAYIRQHLVLKIDGKAAPLSFLGFEREQDAVWSYLEVHNLASAPKTVSIMNDLLYDNFKQQINLMHVTINGKRKSTKLDYPESQATFSW